MCVTSSTARLVPGRYYGKRGLKYISFDVDRTLEVRPENFCLQRDNRLPTMYPASSLLVHTITGWLVQWFLKLSVWSVVTTSKETLSLKVQNQLCPGEMRAMLALSVFKTILKIACVRYICLCYWSIKSRHIFWKLCVPSQHVHWCEYLQNTKPTPVDIVCLHVASSWAPPSSAYMNNPILTLPLCSLPSGF